MVEQLYSGTFVHMISFYKHYWFIPNFYFDNFHYIHCFHYIHWAQCLGMQIENLASFNLTNCKFLNDTLHVPLFTSSQLLGVIASCIVWNKCIVTHGIYPVMRLKKGNVPNFGQCNVVHSRQDTEPVSKYCIVNILMAIALLWGYQLAFQFLDRAGRPSGCDGGPVSSQYESIKWYLFFLSKLKSTCKAI